MDKQQALLQLIRYNPHLQDHEKELLMVESETFNDQQRDILGVELAYQVKDYEKELEKQMQFLINQESLIVQLWKQLVKGLKRLGISLNMPYEWRK